MAASSDKKAQDDGGQNIPPRDEIVNSEKEERPGKPGPMQLARQWIGAKVMTDNGAHFRYWRDACSDGRGGRLRR